MVFDHCRKKNDLHGISFFNESNQSLVNVCCKTCHVVPHHVVVRFAKISKFRSRGIAEGACRVSQLVFSTKFRQRGSAEWFAEHHIWL